ncbi:hypothetical protein L13192_04135 [Pyrenophora tritici-repentis]|nr:hypothetical protein L13192_04135 [Pyrenophora tritici-repentis]
MGPKAIRDQYLSRFGVYPVLLLQSQLAYVRGLTRYHLEAKLRFALHLQVVDKNHLLTARIKISVIPKGRGAGGLQKPHSKVQRLGLILPTIPRHTLIAPHYSPGCRTDPTNGIAKAEAAKLFTKWWDTLTNQDVTIFSDGSEQRTDGERFVTYGYAIYQAQTQIAIGRGSLNP